MNEQLEAFARRSILQGLGLLPDSHVRIFKLMYGRDGGKRSVEDAEKMSIAEMLAEIPAEKLDWALTQVNNTLKVKP